MKKNGKLLKVTLIILPHETFANLSPSMWNSVNRFHFQQKVDLKFERVSNFQYFIIWVKFSSYEVIKFNNRADYLIKWSPMLRLNSRNKINNNYSLHQFFQFIESCNSESTFGAFSHEDYLYFIEEIYKIEMWNTNCQKIPYLENILGLPNYYQKLMTFFDFS